MLVDEIRRQMMAAMKAGDVVRKEVLRVAMGEITMGAERAGGADDAFAQQVLRRIVKSNQETLRLTAEPAQQAVLREEIAVLESLLPQGMSVEAMVEALAPVRDAVKAAPNEGAATGVAMKHLKSLGAAVSGRDVGEAVRRLRA